MMELRASSNNDLTLTADTINIQAGE